MTLGTEKGIVILSNYTGEYYHQLLIIAYNTPCDYLSGDPKYNTSAPWVEVERKEIVTYNATSKYNPSSAIYKVAKYLDDNNIFFTYIYDIVMLPGELLNTTLVGEQEFIWLIEITNDTRNRDPGHSPLNLRFYVDSEGNIIHIDNHTVPPVMRSNATSRYGIELGWIELFGVSLVVAIGVTAIWFLEKKRKQAKLKMT